MLRCSVWLALGAPGSCAASASGQCAMSQSEIPMKTARVTFAVVNVTHATLTYKPAANHDANCDSNGTAISVTKP